MLSLLADAYIGTLVIILTVDNHLTLFQTRNFRLYQIERVQMTISNVMKMAESSPNTRS